MFILIIKVPVFAYNTKLLKDHLTCDFWSCTTEGWGYSLPAPKEWREQRRIKQILSSTRTHGEIVVQWSSLLETLDVSNIFERIYATVCTDT